MTPYNPQQSTSVLTPANLTARLKASISGLCATTIRPTVEVDKTIWNARIRRNDLYYRGFQSPVYSNLGGGLTDYQQVGQNVPLGVQASFNQDQSLYDYVLNFLQGDVDTYIAVLGGRAPNCQAQARDLANDSHVRLKMKADRVNSFLNSHWHVGMLHPQLIRGLALYGTMFSYTRYRISARKYGLSQQTQYETSYVPQGQAEYHCPNCGAITPADQAQMLAGEVPDLPLGTVPCSQCGMPLGGEWLVQPDDMLTLVPSQSVPFANGSVECSILNPAHITAPVYVPDMEHVPWCIKETEEDKGSLLQAFPELREKAYSDSYYISPLDAASLGRYTRELITSPSGYQIPRIRSRWLFTELWMTSACYEYLPGDRNGEIRDWLHENFKDGLKVPMVNGEALVGDPNKRTKEFPTGTPSRIVNERLTSVIAACKPKPGEMLYSDPYFECMIQMQDTVNDSLSMLIEQAERSNPFVIADPEILDPDMLRQYANIPGEFKFAKPGSVGSLDKGFFRVAAAELNPVLISFIDKYLDWCRNITGILPALFGGSSGGSNQTAYEADLKHNQAMMKLMPTWNNVRDFWAKTKENGIYQAAKYSDGKLYTSDQQGTVQSTDIDGIWELMEGGWFMECEESIPQTIGERRNWVMSTLKLPPEIQQKVFGVGDPVNAVEIQEIVGMADWRVPGYDQVIRLHDVIGKLRQQQPIPAPPPPPMLPDPMTGMVPPPPPPGPPMPSIAFDSFLFDPPLALQVVRGWLVSDKAASEQMTNPDGYENVMAYGQSIKQMMGPDTQIPPPKFSISETLGNMTPPAQEAIMQAAGIQLAPGTLAAMPSPKPMPKIPGEEGGGPGKPSAPSPASAPEHSPSPISHPHLPPLGPLPVQ